MYVCVIVVNVFFLMIRRPPSATRTDTLFPYTSLFRSLYSAAAAFAPRNLQRLFADIDRPRAGRGRLCVAGGAILCAPARPRSEEHTSELKSLMRISYAVFCYKKKTLYTTTTIQKDDIHQDITYDIQPNSL